MALAQRVAGRGMSDDSLPKQMVKNMVQQAKRQEDEKRQKEAKRLLDFYSNRMGDYLIDVLTTAGFKKPKEKLIARFNLLHKFADTKAQMFASDPVIQIMDPNTDEVHEADQELFDWLREQGRWDDKLRLGNVWEKLLGTFHIRIHKLGGCINFNLIAPHITQVWQHAEDPSQAAAIMYKVHSMTDSVLAAPKDEWVFWSDSHHFRVIGERISPIRGEDGTTSIENPYGTLPIVKVDNLLVEDDRYWNSGALDVLSANEAVIAGTVALVHAQIHTGFKQPWARNFPKAALQLIGPDSWISQEGAKEGDQPSEIGSIDLSSDIDKLADSIEFLVQQAVLLNNLPPQEFRVDAVAESGFSKLVSRLPLLEERERDVPKWRRTMSNLYELVRIVWNFHQAQNDFDPDHPMAGRTFSEDSTIAVDFPEPSFPESPTEQLDRWEREIELGIKSPVDVMMEANPDLDAEQAMAKLEEIAFQKRQFRGAEILSRLGISTEGGEA